MGALARDLRYASRSLRRSPLFTIVALLTLALGTGANSAIFGVVDTLLVRPLPFPRDEQLIHVEMRSDRGYTISVSIPNARDLRDRNRTLASLGASLSQNMNMTGLA